MQQGVALAGRPPYSYARATRESDSDDLRPEPSKLGNLTGVANGGSTRTSSTYD